MIKNGKELIDLRILRKGSIAVLLMVRVTVKLPFLFIEGIAIYERGEGRLLF